MTSSAGGNFETFLRHEEQMAVNDFSRYHRHLETGAAQELFPDTETGKMAQRPGFRRTRFR